MTENPYDASDAPLSTPVKTRPTRWLVWSGVASLVAAVGCVASTIIGMIRSFNIIATSPTTPKPSELAQDISTSLLPSIAVMPFAFLGVVLLIAGFVIRQPKND